MTTLDRYIANKSTTGSSLSGGTTLDRYISKSGGSSALEEARKRIAERDIQFKKQQQLQSAQQEAQRYAQEAEQANTPWARAGEYVFGAGGLKEDITQKALPAVGKFLGGVARLVGPAITPEQQYAKQQTQIGAVKNLGELASGTAKLITRVATSQYNPLNPAASLVASNEGVKKARNTFLDETGILNYSPDYKNEYQKTGGDIAEVGSWFIPVTRIGKVAKLEKALLDIPKVSKLIGSTPRIIKSGGQLFYEVGKDAVDIGVLDATRGKDWETIQEDMKIGAIGGSVIRGIGKILSKLGTKAPIIEEKIKKGETTEDEVAKIFDEEGVKGLEEAFALEAKVLKPGELAPIVKTIEEKTSTKLSPAEVLKVKSDIERGISPDAIVNDIIEPPKKVITPKVAPEAPKLTPEAPAVKSDTTIPKVVEQPVQTNIELPKAEPIPGIITPTETLAKQGEAKDIKAEVEGGKTSISPILERINKNLDEATKIDEKLATTNHKEQLKLAEENILKDPRKAYNDAVFGDTKMSEPLRTSQLTILFENAKLKGDTEAMAEIGSALAKHGRKSGQEIEMIKAMLENNPTNKAIVSLAKAKMDSVASKFKKLSVKNGEDSIEKLNKVVKDTSKRILLRERVAKVLEARELIKSLTCKV